MTNPQNLTPFKKGHTMSKGHGRPKGSKSLTTILKHALEMPLTLKNNQSGKHEKKPTSEWLVAVMVREALKGDKTHMREIWDRVEGKPLQTVSSQETIELDLSTLTDEQLDRLIERGNLE